MGLVKSPKDFWAATIYIALGAAMLYVGADYRMGSAGRMGPGYFPKVLATLLIAIGLFVLVRSFLSKGDGVDRVVWITVLTTFLIPAVLLFVFGADPGKASTFVNAITGSIGGPQVLLLLGAVAAVAGAVVSPTARPLLLLSLACALFAWLLPRLGFGVALAALCVVSAAASKEFRFEWKATLGLAALVVVCAAVFVKGLGVPMPLWGEWLDPYVAGMPAWLK